MSRQYTDEDIKEYMKKAGKDCIKIRQISHKEATNKSFKICIKHADMNEVMDPEFWGEGIKCREWVR